MLQALLKNGNAVDVVLDRKPIALAFVTLALANAPSSFAAGDPALVAARNRNPSLQSYTFRIDVAMRMRTFPWLHFHVGGTGNYVRSRKYEIQFTQMPFFAKNVKTIDLRPLDPTMWRSRYVVQLAGRKDGMTTFYVRQRKIDPADQNPLQVAEVTLDSNDATRDVVLHYSSGSIHMTMNPGDLQGYVLPVSSEVDIDMPGQSLNAHADFSDYAIKAAGWVAQRH